jgi:hypothetical protein
MLYNYFASNGQISKETIMTNKRRETKKKGKLKVRMPVVKPIPVSYVQAEHGARIVFSLRRVEQPALWSGLLTPDPKAFLDGRPNYLLHLRSIRSEYFGISDIELCLDRIGMWLKTYLHLADETPVPVIKIVDRKGVNVESSLPRTGTEDD